MIPNEVLKEVLKLMAKYGIKKENMLADYPTLKWLFLTDRIPTIITGQPIEITPICVNLADHLRIKEIEQACKEWMNGEMSDYKFASYIRELFGIEL